MSDVHSTLTMPTEMVIFPGNYEFSHNLSLSKINVKYLIIFSLIRDELAAGMGLSGQFSAQESNLIFDLADTDGNGIFFLSIYFG